MRAFFWIAVSSACYAASVATSLRLDAEGLQHTDPPCERRRRDPWEERRVAALRRIRP